MPPEGHTPELQLPLDVCEADLPDPLGRVLSVVTGQRGQHQHLRGLHLAGDVAGRRGLLSTLRRSRGRGGVVPAGRVQVNLRAPGD